MSALTDLFSAMATKIRSKTGTQTTYTPSEMVSDGIDDVYDAGVAAGGPSTPITPSNSSPASMTSGTKYTPSTNGYAIASYDSVTPSSTPESVASGDIVKIGGSGVIVDAIPTPTSITPSNSSPVALTADTPVKPTASGYAIASYSSVTPSNDGDLVSGGDIVKFGGSGVVVDDIEGITPSDSSPVELYTGHYYGMGDDGYAIASYSTATPSNSSPAYVEGGKIYKIGGNLTGYVIDHYNTLVPSNSSPAVISSGDMRKVNANGYAIESYTSVTPSSTQTAVSSGDIVKIGGNGVIVDTVPPTPTSITPSNATPVALTADTPVNPTTAGYAIESYNTKTPSNATPASLVSGEIDKMGGAGYAIESYTALSNLQISVSAGDMLRANGAGKVAMLQQLTPSNTNPPSIDYVGGYYAAPTSGYVISSYSSVTPSSTPTSVSAGNMVQINGSGAIVDAVTSIIPSNTSPVSLSSGNFYAPSASGYAISSYSSKTPSTTNRSYSSLSSGSYNKIQTRTGYLYGAIPTGRCLFGCSITPARTSTSWMSVTFGTTAYDADGTGVGTILDNQFGHINTSDGTIVVDRAISTAYIAGQAYLGRTSSPADVYSGIRILKNGTEISGASVYGSSSNTDPSFRRVSTSFAVGDVITIQTRVSSTSVSRCRATLNITTA